MERDKLEKLLHDKLNRIEIEPTSGVWAKLESDLESTGVQHSEQSESDGYVPQINIRMPSKGKGINGRRSWIYVAAAVMVVAMLIGTIRSFDRSVELSQDEYEYTEIYNPFEENIDDVEQVEQMAVEQVERGADSRPTSSRTATKRAPGETLSVNDVTHIETEVITPTQESDTQTNLNSPDVNTQSSDDKRSDMKSKDMFVAEATTKAEFSRPSRRTAPVDFSLFTSNMGGKSDVKSARGGGMLTSSGFHVDEDSEGTIWENRNTRKYKHRLPLSFGVSLAINLTHRVSIQTGINYTYMLSEADVAGMDGASEAFDYSLKQRLHYIGIPISVKYNFISGGRLQFYASAGGMIEKGVSGNITYRLISQDRVTSAPASEKVKMKGLQASLAANLGLEFKMSQMFGIYIEPGMSYYFKNSNQPTSYRTENPLNFTLKAGLRLHF